ncbi:MAG: sodium-dependent transporter [Candidatus Peribacteraceae bacterium]|jgi:NSS family neurotransmitter:Na+ symporter|nr:sodium-dependent transporter [Candidatus Peribacteraceae bacterium]HCI03663.1 hypothetical protein [Candidatus Peribacteria bacterium]|tara:strand:+ start:14797 stop:16299 length:1503 start_codon:yes stop_codon:yes gene_type:complete
MTTSAPLWKSKWLFILAAIGAAAGLGNLWRFPYMVYDNGGAAFIVAYLVCLLVFVIPLVTLETAWGQLERKEIVSALGAKAGWFGRFIGWMIVLTVAGIAGYYLTVIGWSVNFLYHSPMLAWGENAQEFFFTNILNFHEDPFSFGGFSTPILVGLVISYLTVYFSIFKGITSISHVIKWTVPLPFILLLVLFLNSLTLPGSTEGFKFLILPDWSKLSDPEVWRAAAGQSFFSANIGFGLIIMYAGFNHEKTNIAQAAFIVSIGNVLVSVLAALAIFGTLGYTAAQQGIALTEVVASGPTLAFVAFPNALYTLPFARELFATLFFLTVFTLAIDSAFAIIEIVATTVRNEFKEIYKKISHEVFMIIMCVILFFWSLAFAGRNGLLRLDVFDHLLVEHVVFWFLIPEFVILAWITPVDKLRKYINQVSRMHIGKWFNVLVKFLVPVLLAAMYIPAISGEFTKPYGDYPVEFLKQWMMYPAIVIIVASALLAFRSHRKARAVK